MKVPETFKLNLLANLDNFGLDDTWKLRGNLHVLKNYMILHPSRGDGVVLKNIEDLLEVSSELYQFLSNIKSQVTSADYNKLARILNTAGDGVLAVEEIVSAEDVTIPELIMSGLAILLTYVGNTAYISSALEGCEAQIMSNSIVVYDKLWDLVHRYKKDASPQDLEKINQTMNNFFKQISNRDIPLTARVTIITGLYQLLCAIYVAGILKNVKWVGEA